METVTANTIPFSIRVNTGHSLKKVGYAESTNEEEKGWYNITFSDEDVANQLKMIIKEGNTQIGEATLDNAKTATFSGGLTQLPSSNADLTAEISVSGSKNSSDESLADLLATCAHNFSGEFKFGDKTVNLTDQNAYLAITMSPCCEHEIKINTTDYTVKDGRIWIAIPADVTSTGLGSEISNEAEEVSPGTIYTVARQYFTVADGKKVYFSPGNLQYNPKQNQWQFAAHQYDICIKADNNDVPSMYNKDYDGWIDLFGWGTWLNGNGIEEPYETQTDNSKTYIWSGNSAIGENWTTLSKDEWTYLLGNCLRATKEVNGFFGLVILPDESTANIANDSWENLEKAGAVFLPVAGSRFGTDVYGVGGYGYYWSSSAYGEYDACYLYFCSDYVGPDNANYRSLGLSVRLVRAL